jgi:hypothetical protein
MKTQKTSTHGKKIFFIIPLLISFFLTLGLFNQDSIRTAIQDSSLFGKDDTINPEIEEKIIKKARITAFPAAQIGGQTAVISNSNLTSQNKVLVINDQRGFNGLNNTDLLQEGYILVKKYPTTVASDKVPTFVAFQNLNDGVFNGLVHYQEPISGTTYQIQTDEHQVMPFNTSPIVSTGELSYYYFNLDNVVSYKTNKEDPQTNTFKLKKPLAYQRIVDLKTAEYRDEPLELPESVTSQEFTISIKDKEVFLNENVYPIGSLKKLVKDEPANTGYSMAENKILKDGEVFDTLTLRAGASLELSKSTETQLYLSTVVTENNIRVISNVLEYDLTTKKANTIFNNTYQTGVSDLTLQTPQVVDAQVITPIVTTEEAEKNIYTVNLSEYALTPDQNRSVNNTIVPEKVTKDALEFARNTSYEVPKQFQNGSIDITVLPSNPYDNFGQKVITNHQVDTLSLTVVPKDSYIENYPSVEYFDYLKEFYNSGKPVSFTNNEKEFVTMSRVFNPGASEGLEGYYGFTERLESDIYDNVFLVPSYGCYGQCVYSYAIFMENGNTFQKLSIDAQKYNEVITGDSNSIEDCKDDTCVRDKYENIQALVIYKKLILEKAKNLQIIK